MNWECIDLLECLCLIMFPLPKGRHKTSNIVSIIFLSKIVASLFTCLKLDKCIFFRGNRNVLDHFCKKEMY